MNRMMIGSVIFLVLLIGCSKKDVFPTIRYGQDVCGECKMIIVEERFAAAIKHDGEVDKFDDIGCALKYSKKMKSPPEQFWVHNFKTNEWLNLKQSVIVQSSGLITPMGYGMAAFSDSPSADQWVKQYGGSYQNTINLNGGINK